MKKEIYKTIKEAPDYKISNYGNIKSYKIYKDGKKDNNYYKNLEWCDTSYNLSYTFKVLNKKWNRETHSTMFKKIKTTNLNNNEVLIFDCIEDCARYYNMNSSSIFNRLRGDVPNPSLGHKCKAKNVFFERI